MGYNSTSLITGRHHRVVEEMKSNRKIKDAIYEQVAHIAKAAANSKRLELIEILCQAPKTVQALATESDISIKLASAHLKELRVAGLVEAQRKGKHVFYKVANEKVSNFWVSTRLLAEDRSIVLQNTLQRMSENLHEFKPTSWTELLEKAKTKDLIIIDVRPVNEFEAAHLPHAQSLPLEQLKTRFTELPKVKTIIAYCRGPYCFWAQEAVALLRKEGYQAFQLRDGVAEWQLAVRA